MSLPSEGYLFEHELLAEDVAALEGQVGAHGSEEPQPVEGGLWRRGRKVVDATNERERRQGGQARLERLDEVGVGSRAGACSWSKEAIGKG